MGCDGCKRTSSRNVRRKPKELNGLEHCPQVTHDDVLAAAERIAGRGRAHSAHRGARFAGAASG